MQTFKFSILTLALVFAGLNTACSVDAKVDGQQEAPAPAKTEVKVLLITTDPDSPMMNETNLPPGGGAQLSQVFSYESTASEVLTVSQVSTAACESVETELVWEELNDQLAVIRSVEVGIGSRLQVVAGAVYRMVVKAHGLSGCPFFWNGFAVSRE